MKTLVLVCSSIALGSCGQILLKRGMQIFGQTSVGGVWKSLPRILVIPHVTVGFVCFALSAVLWLVVLSKHQLSYVYPLVSINYILILVASALWFHEPVNTTRIAGVLVICLGVILITRS